MLFCFSGTSLRRPPLTRLAGADAPLAITNTGV
jgi:hypothetical protein